MISIIVPVYNTDKFLNRCIDSILSQSYQNFELILIDDGSTDDSLSICNSYILKDNRIKVISKNNEGVSSARNVGLKAAKGDWVCFIDSDDEMLPNALEAYNKVITSEIDVIRAGFERIKHNSKYEISTKNLITSDKETVICTCFETRYEAYLWNSCFRYELIKDLRFNELLSFCEDHLFTFTAIAKSRKVAFISDIVYRYYAPDSSMIGSSTNLSSRYLEPSMILKEAELEKIIKESCLCSTDVYGIKVVKDDFKWKVRHALKYAIIGKRYWEAYSIVRKYKECSYSTLLRYFFNIKVIPLIRKLMKKY